MMNKPIVRIYTRTRTHMRTDDKPMKFFPLHPITEPGSPDVPSHCVKYMDPLNPLRAHRINLSIQKHSVSMAQSTGNTYRERVSCFLGYDPRRSPSPPPLSLSLSLSVSLLCLHLHLPKPVGETLMRQSFRTCRHTSQPKRTFSDNILATRGVARISSPSSSSPPQPPSPPPSPPLRPAFIRTEKITGTCNFA